MQDYMSKQRTDVEKTTLNYFMNENSTYYTEQIYTTYIQ